jgi:hypothetical protein
VTQRAELAPSLARAGLPEVEAARFVSPKRVPAMAGADDVLRAVDDRTTSAAW